MNHRRIAMLSALGAMTVLSLSMSAVHAGTEDGTVILRLELRGPVVATDTFFMGGSQASDGTILPHPAVCGPPSDLYNDPDVVDPCTTRTYELTFTMPVGTELPIGVARDEHWDGTAEGGEDVWSRTVTVTSTPQTFTVVYDYGLGSTTTGTLPDTAMSVPAGAPTPILGLGGIGLIGTAIGLAVLRVRGSRRTDAIAD